MKRAHNWLLSSVEEGGNDFGRILKQSNEIRTIPIRKNDAEKEV